MLGLAIGREPIAVVQCEGIGMSGSAKKRRGSRFSIASRVALVIQAKCSLRQGIAC